MSASASRSAGDFASRIAAAQHQLAESAARAGLRQDPYQHLIAAQSDIIGLFPELAAQIEAARQPVRDDDLRRAVIQGISVHARAVLETMGWRNVILAAGILFAGVVIGAGAGYWFGHRTGLTETAPFATMAPAEAAGWSQLMRDNSAVNAIAACQKGEILKSSDGRRACAMPVWLDPASTLPPVSR